MVLACILHTAQYMFIILCELHLVLHLTSKYTQEKKEYEKNNNKTTSNKIEKRERPSKVNDELIWIDSPPDNHKNGANHNEYA